MERKEAVVAGAAVALVLYTLALSVLGPIVSAALSNRTISNAGSVKAVGVGVYWDQSCSDSVTSIDWGVVEPSSNVSKTVYIRNEGSVAASLSMTTSNWIPPEASDYMTLDWNYAGQTLNVNDVVQVELTLVVVPDIAGIANFSFDITITASG